MANKATQLSDPAVSEMTLVFREYDGKAWGPRNPESIVLGTKAGEITAPQIDESRKSKSFLGKLWDSVTGAIKGAVVTPAGKGAAEDAIQGALACASYDVLWSMTNQLQWDLYAIFATGDAFTPEQKKAAATTVFDGFTAEMAKVLPLFLGEYDLATLAGKCAEKAGARTSAADKAHLDAISEAHGKLGKAVVAATKAHDAIGDHLDQLMPTDDPKTNDGDAGGTGKAKADDKKPYGDVEYADPENGKYPIDTEEHAKAAWSYINQEKNANEYSADDLAKVKGKIKAACEKFGIDISDSKAAPAEEFDMTKEEIAALVADTAKATAEAVKAELQPQIDAAKAEADTAKADAEKAKADAETAKNDADVAKAAQAAAEKAGVATARATLGSSGETVSEDARKARKDSLFNAVKAALGANPEPTKF